MRLFDAADPKPPGRPGPRSDLQKPCRMTWREMDAVADRPRGRGFRMHDPSGRDRRLDLRHPQRSHPHPGLGDVPLPGPLTDVRGDLGLHARHHHPKLGVKSMYFEWFRDAMDVVGPTDEHPWLYLLAEGELLPAK